MKNLALILVILTKIIDSAVISNSNDDEHSIIRQDITTSPIFKPWPVNTTVCYEYVGCFNNNPPYNNTQLYLPVDPGLINTEFLLFNKNSPTEGQFITYKNIDSIKNSKYDPNLPLKIVVHGFYNNLTTPWLIDLKNSLLTLNVNVIVTGWGDGAAFPFYGNASSNIRVVGKEMGLLVEKIINVYYNNQQNKLNVHCIGHSLGSHICAHAGTYTKTFGFYFDRISGMDPAGPFFENENELVRLDPSDAKYVDVLHTNGGSIPNVGYLASLGHQDFFINGGSSQPGCSWTDLSCSHARAYLVYIESIKSSCAFVGIKCDNMAAFEKGQCSCKNNECSQLGIYSDQFKSRGSFYLITQSKPDFCGEQYLITIKISANSNKTAGEIFLKFGDTSISITKSSEDIKPGIEIKKLFAINSDIYVGQSYSLNFNKKPKSFWEFTDPNAPSFNLESIEIVNIATYEALKDCNENTIVNHNTPIQHQLANTC